MRARFSGLWRHSDFMKLWTGQTISVYGSLIGGTALQFTAILFLHVGAFQVALLTASRLIPAFMAGLVAGAWVDRLRRRPIMIGADLGRATALCTIPVAAALGVLHIEQLYVVAFLTGILELFFDVAYRSYLPSLVHREELVEGNSKLSASSSVAEVAGFGVAGWLVQIFTAPFAILIDALSFLLSALSLKLIRAPETAPAPLPEGPNLRREIVDGLREVVGNPVLRAIAVCVVTVDLFDSAFGAVVVLYMSRGLGFNTGVLGMIWAVGGLSSLLGAVVAGRAARRLGVGPAMISGLLLSSLGALFIPLAHGATAVAALMLITQQLVGDGAFTIYEINQLSLRQTIAPDRLLGRVNASLRFVGLGAMLVGTLLGGLLGQQIGLRATLVIGACGASLAALWLMLSPVRALKAAPAPLEEATISL